MRVGWRANDSNPLDQGGKPGATTGNQHGQPDEGRDRHLHSLVHQGGGVLDPGCHHQIKTTRHLGGNHCSGGEGQGGVFTRQGGATRTMEERDVLGGIWVAPEGLNFFPFEDLHVCPFVPNFTFTFVSDSEIWFCTILFWSVCNSMWTGPERQNMLCDLKHIERKNTGKGYCLSRDLREK